MVALGRDAGQQPHDLIENVVDAVNLADGAGGGLEGGSVNWLHGGHRKTILSWKLLISAENPLCGAHGHIHSSWVQRA